MLNYFEKLYNKTTYFIHCKYMNVSYHFRKVTNNSGQFVKYLTLEQDINTLRGQMLYRSKNLGIK